MMHSLPLPDVTTTTGLAPNGAGLSRPEIDLIVHLSASFAEKVEKHLVKSLRRLDLRGVAEIRKLDQLRAGYTRRSRLAEHGVIPKRRADRRRRQILAKRGGVFVSDHHPG